MTTPAVEELSDDVAEEPLSVEAAGADRTRPAWGRLFGFALLPAIALILALPAGFLRWQDSSARDAQRSAADSVAAAREGVVALLTYQPSTVDKELVAARDRLTGSFREEYTKLTSDVVIPGAKEKHISAVASVPAAASISATESHAVALILVDQTVIVGNGAPTGSSSSVRVTLDKVGDRWLISGFEPI